MNAFLQKLQQDFNDRITDDDTESNLSILHDLRHLVKVAVDQERRRWTLSQFTEKTLQQSIDKIQRTYDNAVMKDQALPVYVETELTRDYLEAGFDPGHIKTALARVLALDTNIWAIIHTHLITPVMALLNTYRNLYPCNTN